MSDGAWDREVDMLVAGAGPAGMSAALIARIEGLDVLLCEKSAYIGGTGAYSAGSLWVPGNSQAAAAGWTDSREAGETYFDAVIPDPARRHLRTAFLDSGAAALDYLNAHSDTAFVSGGKHPDYRSEAPGAAIAGRVVVCKPFDGRLLGADFDRVRPAIPEFTVLGGMMVSRPDIAQLLQRYRSWKSFRYSAGLVLRHAADRLRYRRGTRLVMGNALVARLFYSLRKRQVPIEFETSLVDLVVDSGAVIGAVIGNQGRTLRIRTRRGVVLATGGIGHDRALAQRHFPDPADLALSCPTVEGDGMSIATAAGGHIDGEGQGLGAVWTPVSKTVRADGEQGLFPHFMDTAKPGIVAVAADGRRFVDESLSYHDIVAAMYSANADRHAIPAFFICDSRFLARYGLGKIKPGEWNVARHVRSGYVSRAPSLTALAAKIGVDPDGLVDTIARNNRFAISGQDEDFGRGSTQTGIVAGDPEVTPNPCLGPIDKPPFYALAVWPAPTASGVGLATDSNGAVLGQGDRPIPGLYACGNDMSSIMGGVPTGPGLTLGPAIVFAYRLAMVAAHPNQQLETVL